MSNPYNCDVLLLSAGFGKRLGDLTKNIPKPLVEVAGRTLLDRNLQYLAKSGFKKIFINLHYRADKIRNYVGDGSNWGLNVYFSEEPLLLDTGGAVAKIRDKLFGERLLVFNSDIILDSNFLLSELFDFHLSRPSDNLATLVVREDKDVDKYGSLGLSEQNQIVKFLNFTIPTSAEFKSVMFTGISILENLLISRMPSISVYSLTKDVFKIELERGGAISGYLLDNYWCDVGTPERLVEAETYLKNKI